MKLLLPLLLLAGAACAQAPDSAATRHWHLGETVGESTDRLLAKPGWTLRESTDGSRAFVSTNGRQHILLGLRDGRVALITLAAPIGSPIGPYVLKGATKVDDYHWQNAREHARITRSYTGEQEVYRVEWVPN